MVISESMQDLVKNSSAIRKMFEEGIEMAKVRGAENVFDFSLGNPSVPAPAKVDEAIRKILDSEDSLRVHGYMPNAGFPDVRTKIAGYLNKRFGQNFTQENIVMTGHQDNPGTPRNLMGDPSPVVDLVAIIRAAGVPDDHMRIVDPLDSEALQGAFDAGYAAKGPFVIVTKRPCAMERSTQSS